MRQWQTFVLVVVVCLVPINTLPVKDKKPSPDEEKAKDKEAHEGDGNDDWELNLEYGRYLKEVVQTLESDQAFRKKLETAEVDDIKSGKIARELHFVDHNVRTKLDELKRRELERLRHLAIKEHEKQTGVDRNLLKVPVHIDHHNPTRFEVEDLKKLIIKTTEDLQKVDDERKKEFKKYELEKEYDRQEKLQQMDETHRNEAVEQHEQEVKRHKQHEKLHHPGSKQQLEEVWEEQDHMQPENFDPKTFFHLHDLDGNGYWDQIEVKALFKKELDKMYDPNAPEDDIMERYEEMERMREHVFQESDINKDNLISFEEFVDQTKRADFEQDNGWQGLDEQELYSQQEYEEYQRQRHEEIQRLVESGVDQVQTNQINYPPQAAAQLHPDQLQQAHPPQLQQAHPAQVQGHPPQVQGQLPQVQGQAPQVQGQPPQVQGQPPQVYQGQTAQAQQGQPVQVQPPQVLNQIPNQPNQNKLYREDMEAQQIKVKSPVAGRGVQAPPPPQPIAGQAAHSPQAAAAPHH